MPDVVEHPNPTGRAGGRVAARSAIALSFVVAFEIAIMISPFAFFFYAVFNPILLALDRSPLTRWLTAFFLPHMIVPPDAALTALRVLGSVAFVAGAVVFLACAAQVYVGKALRSGPATGGLYAVVRHPQYVGLAVAAWGLAIMWPRFLTLVLFAIMLFLYYVLARDEERRMLARFGDGYRAYVDRTGMFVPRGIEAAWPGRPKPEAPLGLGKAATLLLALLVMSVGSGFALRAYTIRHLPLEQVGGVDVIAITREDVAAARALLPSVLENPAVISRVRSARESGGHRLLAYVIPVDYTMQGMIADTGEEWKLFEQHKTLGMITEYVFHPFAHLTEGHGGHGEPGAHPASMHDSPALRRRIIFIDVSAGGRALSAPADDFGIDVRRRPLLFADVHLHTGEILQVRETPPGSGWGTVPTPMF
jgi:protein-S-isoprenylcysteine O-methyltransferase Ste14